MNDPATPREPAGTKRILAVLFVGVLMGALDIAIVGPALPAMRQEFGADERAISWVFTIYVLFNLVGTPLMAKLSDRLGRRLVYTLDVALFAIGSLVVATSRSLEQVLVGRAVQAFGAGGIFPVASAVIGDTLPPEKRGRALGLIGAVFGIAFLLGPFVAALLLRFGWQWLFIVNLPVAAALMAASWRILPGALPRVAAMPFDWPGVLLLSGALACAATVAVERRAADPVLRPSWFASRQIRLVALFAAGAGLGEAAMVFLPDLAVSALGMTAQDSSYILVPVVLALAIGSPLIGRLLDGTGPKPIVLVALVSLAAGAAVPALLPTTQAVLIVAGVLVGLGLSGLLGAPLRYILLTEVPAEERAAAQGLLTVFIGVGQLLCGVLIGAIASSAGGGALGYREAFGTIAVLVAVMAVASLGLVNRRPA